MIALNPRSSQHRRQALVVALLLAPVGTLGLAWQDPPPAVPEVVQTDAPETQGSRPVDSLHRIRVGEQLPEFSLTSLDGAALESDTYRGRTLVLVYLSAEQRNSERAAADALRVVKHYADEPLELLLVSADLGHEKYFRTLFGEAQPPAPLAFDGGHELYSKLGLIVFPSTLVVGADGTLKHVILTRRSDYPHLLDAYIGHALGRLSSEVLEQRIVAPTLSRSSPKTMAQRHREAARLLRNSELNTGAEQELLRAVELDPESTPIRIDLADLYIHLGRVDDADALLGAILAADPEHRGARLLLGILRFSTGQLDEAERILLDALVLNPDPERTHYYLGRVYEARGEQAQAIVHYRHALDRLFDQ